MPGLVDCKRHCHITLAQLVGAGTSRWPRVQCLPPFAVTELELELDKGGSPAYVSIDAITDMGTSGACVFSVRSRKRGGNSYGVHSFNLYQN